MDSGYLKWLKRIILPAPSFKSFNLLIDKLYSVPFDPIMNYPDRYFNIASYDDNRAGDGVYLRYIYSDITEDPSPCTMLEMLIALGNRFDGCVGFNVRDTKDTRKNFWIMIKNLGLDIFDDSHYEEDDVDRILHIFLTRTYLPNGSGGLFPLRKPKIDQRKIEIWSQLQEYLVENDL